MQFGNPQAAWLFLPWLLLALLCWRSGAWRRGVARRLGQAELIDRLFPPGVRRWRRRRALLMLAASLLLVIAAARPQYGRIEQTVHSSGTNVIIALDTSRSMTARDVLPNRLDRAKQCLASMLRRLSGNRVGIVAFAGTAFLQCPMTLDHGMAALVLKALDVDSVGTPGTDLGTAIDVATQAFERGAPEGGRALVLLTDGEDNEGRGIDSARQAAEKGIRIYAVGIGTSRGSPLVDEGGKFKEDQSGSKVNSRLDMATLTKIADATGGKAFEAGDTPERTIEQVTRLINTQEKADLESRRQVIYQDRFQWFLLPALILLLWMLLSRPEPTRIEGSSGLAPAPRRAGPPQMKMPA